MTRRIVLISWYKLCFCAEWWRPFDIKNVHLAAIRALIDPSRLER